MSSRILWQVFLRVKSREKAHLLLKRIAQALDREFEVVECERYWKDETLFQAVFRHPLAAETGEAAVLEALRLCWRLARRWTVGSLSSYAGNRWQFEGLAVARDMKVVGVHQVFFDASNIEHPAEPIQAEGYGHREVTS